MNTSRRRLAWSELVTTMALALALVVVGLALRRLTVERDTVRRTRMSSWRAQAQDALIGTTIDVAAMLSGGREHPGSTRPLLLWVVDLERCLGCFDSVAEWVRLEQLVDHDLILLTIGETTSAVQARLGVLRRTVVKRVSRNLVGQALGNVLPNTKLMLDGNHIAVLVDSRASGQECGWSFEAQVGALRGLNSARSIRAEVAPAPLSS